VKRIVGEKQGKARLPRWPLPYEGRWDNLIYKRGEKEYAVWTTTSRGKALTGLEYRLIASMKKLGKGTILKRSK